MHNFVLSPLKWITILPVGTYQAWDRLQSRQVSPVDKGFTLEQFQTITINQAQELLTKPEVVLVDTRDSLSFSQGHIEGAFPLSNDTVVDFMNETEFEQPILVMCYHGISSQNVAQYLINQGFIEVYSVDGGMEAWRRAELPITQ
mgnify:CR=1 FL=1